ncbi:hypothetical protein [Burkholderia vietnamiensis]|uniref:hypothetical protein n=1 Tax=Burkholderia vietnamiensis TaxID=60552 RepID=UPI0012D9108B|nr:hypothetical protein [Burkholderia vietnamiensis]
MSAGAGFLSSRISPQICPIIRRSVDIPVYSLIVPRAPCDADGLSCVTLYVMISILIIKLTGRRTFHVAPLVVSNEWKLLRERA